jgi:hypothetical protein
MYANLFAHGNLNSPPTQKRLCKNNMLSRGKENRNVIKELKKIQKKTKETEMMLYSVQ